MHLHKYITVFTDGSCNPVQKIGAWVAIVLIDGQKIILKGQETNTTNQRMELTSVLNALQYINENHPGSEVNICTDSQYVIGIQKRRPFIERKNFLTKKATFIRNDDLVRVLISFLDSIKIEFTKVVAHQKSEGEVNYNREADQLARAIVRNLNQ